MMTRYEALQKERAAEAGKELIAVMVQYTPIAKGQRNGTSWKAALEITARLSEVLEVATAEPNGLIHGPGKTMMVCKDVLGEVIRECSTSQAHTYF